MAGTAIPTLDLCLVRGDSDDILVTVRQPDPNDIINDPPDKITVRLDQAVDGTAARPAVLRFAVKEDPDDANAQAIIFKRSGSVENIEVLDQTVSLTEGQAVIHIDKEDTEDDCADTTKWDLEVSQQDYLRGGAQTGTIQLQADTGAVIGTGTTFTKVKRGDMLQTTAGGNQATPAIVILVTSDTEMTVEFTDWTPETGIAFEIRRGRHFTAARGDFTLEDGQVKN